MHAPSAPTKSPLSANPATDGEAFRALARKWAATVTVVTGRDRQDNTCDGFTATAFLTVSMAPPIILVSATVTSSAGDLVRQCDQFTIHLLEKSQQELANLFALSAAERSARLHTVSSEPDPDGALLLHHTLGAFSARKRELVPAGDHVLLLADVTRIWLGPSDAMPLVYAERAYRSLT
ncbi:MAG: flavin reductase family protein [Deltaproteobacteria bacterium]|nr:flavin reductase family protein [Deltaproteobacteria bacterium]